MQFHLSISKMPYVVPVTFCPMAIRFMLPVYFEKRLCPPVEFKGQGLQLSYGYKDMCSGHKTTECIGYSCIDLSIYFRIALSVFMISLIC